MYFEFNKQNVTSSNENANLMHAVFWIFAEKKYKFKTWKSNQLINLIFYFTF